MPLIAFCQQSMINLGDLIDRVLRLFYHIFQTFVKLLQIIDYPYRFSAFVFTKTTVPIRLVSRLASFDLDL